MSIIKKIIIVFIILALAGVGVLVFTTIRQMAKKKSETPPVILNSSGNAVDQVRQQEFNDALKKTSASDQDFDGLPDSEEAKYKTNPASADTDGDGLMDRQEIDIYKTDPLKADTDADGKSDGYEARRGMNPLVKGK